MLDVLLNEENINNFKNNVPFVIRDSGLPDISWQTILELLNDDILNDRKIGSKKYKDYGFRVFEATRIPEVKFIVETMLSVFDKSSDFKELHEENNAHQLYISLTTQEGSYGIKHQDPENVIFWQIQGSSTWTIYKNETDVDVVETLNKGDLIYCPPNRWHNVFPNSPRCGVSMGFGSLLEVK